MTPSIWRKALGLGLVAIGLLIVLARIDWLVSDRQRHQQQAQQEVAAATAGEQRLGAPYLRRACVENWVEIERIDDERGRRELRRPQQRALVQREPAQRFDVQGQLGVQPLSRGLFQVNTYTATLQLQARWAPLPLPTPSQPGATLVCEPAALVLPVSDARGLRSVALSLNGQAVPARPGALEPKSAGLNAGVDEALLAAPLVLAARVELLGTGSFAVQPAAAQVDVALQSAWPHPSFQGRFLPSEREVAERGFRAQWRLTELATNATAALRAGEASADDFGVALLDPVNPYSLSDRSLKYAFLFVALVLAAVLLAELLGRQGLAPVHPVQYAFVGLALVLFFLLLLALSEHLSFGLAYLLAATASSGLLGYYAVGLFGSRRGGLAFGAGIAALYAVLYLLLNLEKASLLVGSLLLFALLAAAMRLTRDLPWYGQRGAAVAHSSP